MQAAKDVDKLERLDLAKGVWEIPQSQDIITLFRLLQQQSHASNSENFLYSSSISSSSFDKNPKLVRIKPKGGQKSDAFVPNPSLVDCLTQDSRIYNRFHPSSRKASLQAIGCSASQKKGQVSLPLRGRLQQLSSSTLVTSLR